MLKDTGIIILAKLPIPGMVKTRLTSILSHDDAAKIQDAFLHDILQDVSTIKDTKLYLAYTPEDKGDEVITLYSSYNIITFPQQGKDIGEKMEYSIKRVLMDNCDRAILIGSDSPTLPASYIVSAITLLSSNDIVLGPATDGGYYLIGLKDIIPSIFKDISWGGGDVLLNTSLCILHNRLKLALLPVWYDVDTIKDLQFLYSHLHAMMISNHPIPIPERTKDVLDIFTIKYRHLLPHKKDFFV